ncbi:hypothetical protein RB195_005509 [Necator americanus]
MYFSDRTRYLILTLSVVCLTLIFSNSIALNFTIICMNDVRSDFHRSLSTNASHEQHWLDSSTHVNSLFSAVAIGTLIGTIPSTFLIHKIGFCKTMTLYGAATTLATLGFPLAVKTGFVAVFIMRILQGIATSLSFPATGVIPAQWSTVKSTGTFMAIISCALQFCNIFTMPVSGFLCESSLGWPSVFYLQGVLSAIAFTTFFFFYKDDPSKHRNVSPVELQKISLGKQGQKKEAIPFRAIITDPCILGVWLAASGGNLGFQVFLIYGPTYINKVLHFNVKSTGFATALPFILSAAVKFVVGPISDRATFVSGRWRLIFFAALSQGTMALCIFLLSVVTNPRVAQVAYTTAIVFSGINIVGAIKSAQLVSRQYAHFVMAVIAFLLCLIIFLVPVAVNVVCPDNTPEQWSNLFLGVSILVVVANIPFLFVASNDPAPWTGNKVHGAPAEKVDSAEIEDLRKDSTSSDPSSWTDSKTHPVPPLKLDGVEVEDLQRDSTQQS